MEKSSSPEPIYDQPGKWNAEAAAIGIVEELSESKTMSGNEFINLIIKEAGTSTDLARSVFFDFCERGIIRHNLKDGVCRGILFD